MDHFHHFLCRLLHVTHLTKYCWSVLPALASTCFTMDPNNRSKLHCKLLSHNSDFTPLTKFSPKVGIWCTSYCHGRERGQQLRNVVWNGYRQQFRPSPTMPSVCHHHGTVWKFLSQPTQKFKSQSVLICWKKKLFYLQTFFTLWYGQSNALGQLVRVPASPHMFWQPAPFGTFFGTISLGNSKPPPCCFHTCAHAMCVPPDRLSLPLKTRHKAFPY